MEHAIAGGFLNIANFSNRNEMKYSPSIQHIMEILGVNLTRPDRLASSLPFSLNDTTAGSETELPEGIRHLHADVSTPHYQYVRRLFFLQILLESKTVSHPSEGEDPRKIDTRESPCSLSPRQSGAPAFASLSPRR